MWSEKMLGRIQTIKMSYIIDNYAWFTYKSKNNSPWCKSLQNLRNLWNFRWKSSTADIQ